MHFRITPIVLTLMLASSTACAQATKSTSARTSAGMVIDHDNKQEATTAPVTEDADTVGSEGESDTTMGGGAATGGANGTRTPVDEGIVVGRGATVGTDIDKQQ